MKLLGTIGEAIFWLALGAAFGLLIHDTYGATVEVRWDHSPSTNVASYRVYHGAAPRTYTNSFVVTCETNRAYITNLQYGVDYYFAATALAANGLESSYSNEASTNVPVPMATLEVTIEDALSPFGPFQTLTVTNVPTTNTFLFYRARIDIRPAVTNNNNQTNQ